MHIPTACCMVLVYDGFAPSIISHVHSHQSLYNIMLVVAQLGWNINFDICQQLHVFVDSRTYVLTLTLFTLRGVIITNITTWTSLPYITTHTNYLTVAIHQRTIWCVVGYMQALSNFNYTGGIKILIPVQYSGRNQCIFSLVKYYPSLSHDNGQELVSSLSYQVMIAYL